MKPFALACIAALSLAAAPAQASAILGGVGTATCAELRYAFDNGSGSDRQALFVAVGQWVFGYYSGRNQEQPSGFWRDLSGFEGVDGTALFILEQCGSYPSLTIIEMADIIYNNLPYASGTS
jgi:hypothetical protein